jgi:DNA replication protein DnaC
MRTLERWKEVLLPKVIKSFTPRIQVVLLSIDLELEKLTDLKDGGYFYGGYFYGKIGSGKTILTIKHLLKIHQDRYLTCSDFTYKFIPITNLLLEIRSSYGKEHVGENELDLIERYSDYDLLILDDFDIEKTSEWSYQILYMIINNRYEGLKTTFFTSNLNLNQLAEKLGDDRITSRISSMCKIIQLTSKDRRPKAK